MASDFDQEDDDNSLDTPPDSGSSDVSSPAGSMGPVQNPVVAAYLAKIKAAQDQVKSNQQATGLTSALVQLGHGISRADGPADLSAVKAMGENDTAPLNNLAQLQMGQQQAMAMAKAQQAADPNSPTAKAQKILFSSMLSRQGVDPKILDGMTADQIKTSMQQPIEALAKIQTNDLKRQELSDAKIAAADTKNTTAHEKYVQHVEDTAKTLRGDPASMRLDSNLAAVVSAKGVLDKYRNPDGTTHYDDMTIPEIQSLVTDKAKIMSGGVPTESEIRAQMPHNVHTGVSGIMSSLSDKFQPANVGGYVQDLDDYFKTMENESLKAVKHRQAGIVNSPRLSPEERARISSILVPESSYKQTAMPAMKPPVVQNGHTYNWNPDKNKYE